MFYTVVVELLGSLLFGLVPAAAGRGAAQHVSFAVLHAGYAQRRLSDATTRGQVTGTLSSVMLSRRMLDIKFEQARPPADQPPVPSASAP